jgi:hypothetical protein
MEGTGMNEPIDRRRQLKHRLMLVWMLFCAFWLAGISIWIAGTRPAPGFMAVGSLLIGGAMVFAALLMLFYLRRAR